MEEDVLRDLGFSEREIKVYLALLELGSTTVGPIAAKTRLQHSKVYQTLEKLIDRGLVTFVIKSKTNIFKQKSQKESSLSSKKKNVALKKFYQDWNKSKNRHKVLKPQKFMMDIKQ